MRSATNSACSRVAIATGAKSDSSSRPRSRVTRTALGDKADEEKKPGESVTVQGEAAGLLTCTTPTAMAGRIAEHFAVGDSVRMLCRGSELAYLEKV